MKINNIATARRLTIHKKIGIYFLVHRKTIVYVGRSVNIEPRVQSHINEKVKIFDSYYYIKCDVDNLDIVESAFICLCKTKYNKKTNIDAYNIELYVANLLGIDLTSHLPSEYNLRKCSELVLLKTINLSM